MICFPEIIRIPKGNPKGVVLVAVVALMVFVGLFAGVSVSLIATSAGSHYHTILGTQALAIAQGGVNWYLEQLRTDPDWTDQAGETKNFAEGSFEISILSAGPAEISFRSTGSVPAAGSGVTVRRNMAVTVRKIPRAFRFALFQGEDPGVNLAVNNSSFISGNVWSLGSVQVNAGNTVTDGKVYVPVTRTVSGDGSYTSEQIQPPYPEMPILSTVTYDDRISSYNALISSNNSNVNRTVSSGTFNLNTDPACSGGICRFRNFTTNGSVTIIGNGLIVANRDLLLHGANGLQASTSLTITPGEGESIGFLAGRNLTVGSNNNNPVIWAGPDCYFYTSSQTLTIRGSQVLLRDIDILSGSAINVSAGAEILGESMLFLASSGSTLSVTGGAGVTTAEGNIISFGGGNPGLRIYNGGTAATNTVVRGLVYFYNPNNPNNQNMGCLLQNATIQGSVVSNRYTGRQVQNVRLTFDAEAMETFIPEGFDNTVSVKPNTWDAI